MLDSVLGAATGETLFYEILICTVASLILGLVIALVHMYKNSYNKGFIITIALLPAMVQSVILLVNGNVGVGVAVMGAFSLVRFRSIPGGAREISTIFFAMAIGLATGMGYVLYAAAFTVTVSLIMLLLNTVGIGEQHQEKRLRVTIPEDVDYSHLFDDLFKDYTSRAVLDRTRTTNLGSLYELQYIIKLKEEAQEKVFLDEIRKRNGNLTISCARLVPDKEGL